MVSKLNRKNNLLEGEPFLVNCSVMGYVFLLINQQLLSQWLLYIITRVFMLFENFYQKGKIHGQ